MRYFKIQLSLLFRRTSFIATFTLMCVYAIAAFLIDCFEHYGEAVITVPAAKYMLMCSEHFNYLYFLLVPFFSLVAAIPFADTFFEERKNKTIEYCIIRCDNNKYYFSKLSIVFFSGFVIMCIPLIINYLLNFIAFPLDSSVDFTNFSVAESGIYNTGIETLVVLKGLFATNMYAYQFIHILLLSVACGFISVIVFQISFFYKKNRIRLIFSFFLIYQIYTIVLSYFNGSEFIFDNYIFSSQIFNGQTLRGVAITWTALILVAFLPIPFAKRKLVNLYE